MANSSKEQSERETERMFHALRQRHRRLAQRQRPVGMAKVRVTRRRIRAGTGAKIDSHRVRQRSMLAWIV